LAIQSSFAIVFIIFCHLLKANYYFAFYKIMAIIVYNIVVVDAVVVIVDLDSIHINIEVL
jgi:hypothetical protein